MSEIRVKKYMHMFIQQKGRHAYTQNKLCMLFMWKNLLIDMSLHTKRYQVQAASQILTLSIVA